MDRETLETLCQTFAARQSSWPQPAAPVGTDPVPEILRSFRLAEISAAEMESLLGLVTADLSKQALTAIAQCAAAAATAAAPPAALAQTINSFLQQAGAPASQAVFWIWAVCGQF